MHMHCTCRKVELDGVSQTDVIGWLRWTTKSQRNWRQRSHPSSRPWLIPLDIGPQVPPPMNRKNLSKTFQIWLKFDGFEIFALVGGMNLTLLLDHRKNNTFPLYLQRLKTYGFCKVLRTLGRASTAFTKHYVFYCFDNIFNFSSQPERPQPSPNVMFSIVSTKFLFFHRKLREPALQYACPTESARDGCSGDSVGFNFSATWLSNGISQWRLSGWLRPLRFLCATSICVLYTQYVHAVCVIVDAQYAYTQHASLAMPRRNGRNHLDLPRPLRPSCVLNPVSVLMRSDCVNAYCVNAVAGGVRMRKLNYAYFSNTCANFCEKCCFSIRAAYGRQVHPPNRRDNFFAAQLRCETFVNSPPNATFSTVWRLTIHQTLRFPLFRAQQSTKRNVFSVWCSTTSNEAFYFTVNSQANVTFSTVWHSTIHQTLCFPMFGDQQSTKRYVFHCLVLNNV